MCMQPRQLCLGCWGGEVLSTPYSAIPRAKGTPMCMRQGHLMVYDIHCMLHADAINQQSETASMHGGWTVGRPDAGVPAACCCSAAGCP